MDDFNADVQSLEDLTDRIIAHLEQITRLPSQWNRCIELMKTNRTAFGGKSFTCTIRLRSDVAQSDSVWATLLHEIFHCFSTGRGPDASLEFSGYEEGVVEQLQRLFRTEILAKFGVSVSPESFVDRDTNSAYTDYVSALEAMRTALTMQAKPFYLALLATPLEQRWATLHEQAERLPEWTQPEFRKRWRQWEQTLQGEVE